ncbi:thiamine-phosphate kinase [Novosphingobium pokkalii]|uniref:Thiamine-monophosphate kinase n=1 Tax=Novosphingobium pokkalii TaxID=1770194 RepID=A0ABV7UYY9_9SPHN|nr:thiamine-phosphate kinase [Novosphingobium pokkalii]GHC99393.1 thiamine-monophosphate kinase [Novosphingobium pokkalii]
MDEAAFIAALRALAPDPAARGLDDDVAVIALGGEHLVLTHDMMVEGVHWLPAQDPADVAWKLVATNLSDLAAKGAAPLGVLLGYGLGGGEERFLAGLAQALAAFDVPLLGGDTVRRAGPAAHGLTALGRATHCPVPTRGGARPGDALWVTGTLGDAMLGFEALREGHAGKAGARDTTRFTRPVPRLAEGRALAPLVGAMMDVSDGLLLDATRMARASGVTLAIDSAACPLPPDLPVARRREALAWGDDYELLFTLPAGTLPPCPATRIGVVQPAGPVPLLLDGACPQGRLGYQHGE